MVPDAPDYQPTMRGRTRRWLGLLGAGLALGGAAFLVAGLIRNGESIREIVRSADLALLVASVLPLLVAQWVTVGVARVLLSAHGGTELGTRVLYRVLFTSNLAKYVPGGVWQVGSHLQLARAAGLSGRHALALWLEVARINVASSLLVAGGGALVMRNTLGISALWGASALAVGAAMVLPLAGRTVLRVMRVRGVAPAARPRPWLLALAIGVAGSSLLGLHGMLVANALVSGDSVGYAAATVAFVGAWVVGFVVFFVPAGLGVREVTMVFLLSPWLDEPVALSIAAASRILFMLVDGAGGALAAILGPGNRHLTER